MGIYSSVCGAGPGFLVRAGRVTAGRDPQTRVTGHPHQNSYASITWGSSIHRRQQLGRKAARNMFHRHPWQLPTPMLMLVNCAGYLERCSIGGVSAHSQHVYAHSEEVRPATVTEQCTCAGCKPCTLCAETGCGAACAARLAPTCVKDPCRCHEGVCLHTCCVFVCCIYMSLLFSSVSAPLLCRCRKMSGPNKGGRAAHDPGVQGSAAAVPQNPDRSVGPGLAVPCRLHLAALLLLLLLLKGAGVCRPGGRPSKWRAGGLFGGRGGLRFIRGSDGLRDSRCFHAGSSTETCLTLWRASSAAAGLQPLLARVLTSTYCLTHLLAVCWRLAAAPPCCCCCCPSLVCAVEHSSAVWHRTRGSLHHPSVCGTAIWTHAYILFRTAATAAALPGLPCQRADDRVPGEWHTPSAKRAWQRASEQLLGFWGRCSRDGWRSV